MPAGPESPGSKKPARPVPAGRPLDPFAIGRSILGPVRTPTPPEVEGFEIEGFIAEGGLGQVWRARHRETSALVALKIPHRADPEVAERLVVEAATLGALRHPHIVGFQGVAETSDGQPVLIMDLVEGATLAARLPDGGFDFEHALQIFFPVLEAVEHAHASGIIHRDLKPTNILLADDGGIVVSDFGLARSPRERALAFSLTQSGAVAGTVEYLAPECYKPNYVPTVAADIFALGILLYELLSGAPPRGAWKPLSEIKRIDVRLDELLREAIDPDPARRPATVGEFRQRLEEIRVAKPRLAGSPLVNKGTRAADFAWTCAGLYFCVAGFCTVLAMTRTPVPAMFNLTYGVPGLLIGGWLGVWTLALGMGVLWLWQIVRLGLFRHTPMREALPSPFGARLGTSTTAAVQVGIIQFLCAWMPVIYALNIMGVSFHWRTETTPIWQDALVVTPWSTDQPVSPWKWHPEKMFDGGAYWLKQARIGHNPTAPIISDKTSFYIFLQPALMVLSAVLIAVGMVWTLVRLAVSWWPTRKKLLFGTAMVGSVAAGLIALVVWKDHSSLTRPPDYNEQTQLNLQYAPYIAETREWANTAFFDLFLHAPAARPGSRPSYGLFDQAMGMRLEDRGFNIVSRPCLQRIVEDDRLAAALENRHIEYPGDSDGRVVVASHGGKFIQHEWVYLQYSDPPQGMATAYIKRFALVGRVRSGGPFTFHKGRRFESLLYAANPVECTVAEASEFLTTLLTALEARDADTLAGLFIRFVATPSHLRSNSEHVVTALLGEREKWDRCDWKVDQPLPAPERRPGGRWHLTPMFTIEGTRVGEPDILEAHRVFWTLDIAQIDGRWKIVRFGDLKIEN
jgi:hypothetical protein